MRTFTYNNELWYSEKDYNELLECNKILKNEKFLNETNIKEGMTFLSYDLDSCGADVIKLFKVSDNVLMLFNLESHESFSSLCFEKNISINLLIKEILKKEGCELIYQS